MTSKLNTAKDQVTLSRWQLNLFTECPRCFWLQNRHGVEQPKGFPIQMDVYTYLLQRLGYRTAPKAYFAFFIAVKDDGFKGRLPFRAQLLEIAPEPDRVHDLFKRAVALAQSDDAPEPGAACDLCRWDHEADGIIAAKG